MLLALFSVLLDTGLPGGWAFPLKVIGANSIVAYVGSHLTEGFILGSFDTHLGKQAFDMFDAYKPLVRGAAVLVIFWLLLFWMYKKRVFVRV